MKSFEKIIGYESVKKELYQIIDMFKNKNLYEDMGANLVRGVIIHGRPGMGKTMLATAVINECNVKSYILRKNKDTKDMVKEINNTFEDAVKHESSIILLDDLDKFSESASNNTDDTVFVTIQACIDSVKDNNVLVIATANNIRKLPDSLKRSGRFDRTIKLSVPTQEDSYKIIEFYLKNKKVDKNINYEDLTKMISYTSCADLDKIINEGAIEATYERKSCVEMKDIVKAFIREQYGTTNDIKCDDKALTSVSIHEAGHAAIAEIMKEGSVGFVSLLPNEGGNRMSGFTRLCYDEFRRPEMVLLALGGKAAVELFHEGRCGSGCQSDLSKAACYLTSGVELSGTCGLGLLNPHDPDERTSEILNSKTEAVVQAELERLMFIAKDMLIKNKDFVLKLAEQLKEKKNLLFSEVKAIRSSFEITPVAY